MENFKLRALFLNQYIDRGERLCKYLGYSSRIFMIDGRPIPITRDYNPTRVNFQIRENKITGVSYG